MFEIPDDDDLFQEESLLVFGENQSPVKCQQVPSSSFLRNPDGKALKENEEKNSETDSPQKKKSRILVDCKNNLQKNVYHEVETTAHGPQEHFPVIQSCQNDTVSGTVTRVRDTNSGEAATHLHRQSERCFPGPAGILPLAKISEMTPGGKVGPTTTAGNTEEATPVVEMLSSQPGGDMFGGSPWQSLVGDLQPQATDVLSKFSVRAMLHKARRRLLPKGKVPLLLCVVDSIDVHGSDAGVVVKDRTGHMEGTLHRDVLRDFTPDLQAGAAVVLRQVSVISPTPRTHYLNITAANIAVIYPVHTPGEAILPAATHTSGQPVQQAVRTYIHTAEMELVEAANAARANILNRTRGRGARGAGGTGNSLSSPNTNLHQGGRGLFGAVPVQTPGGPATHPLTPPLPSSSTFKSTPGRGFSFRGRGGLPSTPRLATSARSDDRQTPGTWTRMAGPGSPGLSAGGVNRPVTSTSQGAAGVRLSANSSSLNPAGLLNHTASNPGATNPGASSVVLSASSPTLQIQTQAVVPGDTPQTRWSFKRKTSPVTPGHTATVTQNSGASCLRSPMQSVSNTWTSAVGPVTHPPSVSHAGCEIQKQTSYPGQCDHPATTRPGESAGHEGKGQGQGARPGHEEWSGVRLQPDTASLQTSQAGATDKTLWSDDLSDDILSQLSDDF